MRYSQLFSYASRLRTLGNEIILAGLRRHGVVGIVPSYPPTWPPWCPGG